MRVVLDTNVIVSGLLWGGPPNQLLRWVRSGTLQVICCEEVVGEVKRVIEYPKLSRRISVLGISSREVIAYLMNLVMHVPSPVPIPAVVAEDPSDDIFLALASANQARLIVSGDQHLLTRKEHGHVPIVTAAEAVDVVKELSIRQ